MADAVRIEHRSERVIDGLIRARVDDADLAQELADGAVRGLVEIAPVEAGPDLRAQPRAAAASKPRMMPANSASAYEAVRVMSEA